MPYTILVNEVKKDAIAGYVATPKDLIPGRVRAAAIRGAMLRLDSERMPGAQVNNKQPVPRQPKFQPRRRLRRHPLA
jgi:hypothetical protein